MYRLRRGSGCCEHSDSQVSDFANTGDESTLFRMLTRDIGSRFTQVSRLCGLSNCDYSRA